MKIAELFEEIKGWKHAGRDLAAARAAKGKDVKLVRLKKDGTESGMHDATKMFRSEEEARAHHANMVKLNPKSAIKHHLYVGDKPQLLEDVITPEEAGWYVCDAKERPHHGPMSEMKAKALADELSNDRKKYTAEYFSDYEISRMNEGVAPPFQKFKKGQIVTVKKTGEKVEVMHQNDIGLVQTASKDALKVPNDKKMKIVPGRGYKEYMPRELEA